MLQQQGQTRDATKMLAGTLARSGSSSAGVMVNMTQWQGTDSKDKELQVSSLPREETPHKNP